MSGTNDEEIKVALTADPTDLQEGMEEGADAVVDGAQTMSDAVAESAAVMTRSYEEIIAAQNRSMAQTAASVVAEQAATDARTRAAAAVETETVATAENTAALLVNGGVARELGVLIGEGIRGNYTRLEGSTITLANRTGLLAQAFTPLGLSIAAVIGSGALLIDEMVKAEERTNSFQAALMATGFASGMSANQLMAAASSLAAFTGDAKGADEIMIKLASSGKLSGQALIDAGTGAANIMRLTGESAEEAAKQVESLAGDPAKAVVELNNKFHFLTVEVYDHITALEAAGKTYEATEVAAKAFADDTTEKVQKLNEQMGYFEQMMSHMKEGWTEIDHNLQKALDPTAMQKSIAATHEWFQVQTQLNEAIKNGESPYYIQQLRVREAADRKIAETLRDQVKAQNDADAASGKAATQAAGTIRDEQAQQRLNDHLKDTSLLQQKITEEKELLNRLYSEDKGSAQLKGFSFDDAGKVIESGEKWDATIKMLTKDYGETGDSARKAAAAAKKSAQEAMTDLEIQRNETAQNSEARIADDEKIAQKALALYGKDSSQYKAALDQKLHDEQAFNKEALASKLSAIDQAMSIYDAQIETQKQQDQLEYDQGKITADQLAELEKALVAKKLAADIAYLNAKMVLDQAAGASGADAAAKEATAIELVKQKALQETAQIDDKAIKAGEKNWSGYASAIGSSFKGAVTGMLFQGETLKQGMASIGESMVGTFVDKTVDKMVQSWMDAEKLKTAATVSGNTARAAAQASADAMSKGIQSAINGSEIQADAATGAAGAYKAVVGIPLVGPVLAPIAATVAYGGIMAYKSIASAAGGWGDIPADQLAMVHKNEMVLPAHLAQGVREMSSGGGQGSGGQGGGDTHNWYVSAIDAKSFQTALRGGLGTQLASYVKQKTQNSPQARR